MKNINWRARFKNPLFIAEIIGSIFIPILGYAGLTAQDLTTWTLLGQILMDAISNPYVLMMIIISVWNAVNDPLSAGTGDSLQGLTYDRPRKRGE